MIDPVELTQALIRRRSVTPADDGAIPLLAERLAAAGFTVHRCDRNGIANLFAKAGTSTPVFGFNGHTDVVPPGDEAAWSHPPFAAEIAEGRVWGRGAVDMKSGVAAFCAAAAAYRAEGGQGAVAILVTGDEEGESVDGTPAILDWMRATGERLDHCLVGEPTCPETLGDMIKIGRRGSLTAKFTATGKQGHTAYPHRAANPVHPLARLLDRLASWELDKGAAHFDPSTLQITTVDVGNPASNVIPERARATINIRFNDAHTSKKLTMRLLQEAAAAASGTDVRIETEVRVSGESFITEPGLLSDIISEAAEAETGVKPVLSTTGGTSDARYVKAMCPVAEFGLVGQTMHQVNESAPVDEIRALARIYRGVLCRYFARQAV